MTNVATWVALGALAWVSVACSGKTERGIAGEAPPAGKPAAGPAEVDPVPPDEPSTRPGTQGAASHLLMVVELEPAARAARTLSAKQVELPLPRKRGRAQPEPWRVEVLGESGAVLYSAPLKNTSEVRGEFPDAQGRLSGVKVQQPRAAVTVRLPLLKDARVVRVLDLEAAGGETELGRVDYPKVGN